MVEVRLHGALAQEFGKVWNFDIASPAEAVAALDAATRKRFRAAIRRLSAAGMVFKVRARRVDLEAEDLHLQLRDGDRLDLVPIVVGANAGTRFVVGAVLVAASFYAGPAGPYMFNTGVALMAGSVIEYMTRVQRKEDEQYQNKQSWTMSGPVQTTDQGTPIPVIYGEVLTSGYTVSAGLLSAQTIDPSQGLAGATIRCENSYDLVITGGGGWVISIEPVVTVEALAPPYTFAWSVAASANIAVSIANGNTATPVITLSGGNAINETVTFSVSINGFDPVLLENPTPLSTSVNKQVGINVNVYESAGG